MDTFLGVFAHANYVHLELGLNFWDFISKLFFLQKIALICSWQSDGFVYQADGTCKMRDRQDLVDELGNFLVSVRANNYVWLCSMCWLEEITNFYLVNSCSLLSLCMGRFFFADDRRCTASAQSCADMFTYGLSTLCCQTMVAYTNARLAMQ